MACSRKRRLFVETLEPRVVLSAAGAVNLQPVIVMLNDDTVDVRASARALVPEGAGQVGFVYEHALRGFSAKLPPAAIQALQRSPAVKAVELDLQMQTTAQVVPTGVERIGAAPGAGTEVDTSSVNIAILDTGIDSSHPDLNVAGGVSFASGNWNDVNGHGTHVAGIAAALDNGSGVVGVAPGANLWAVKVLNNNGSGSLSGVIAGIDWVTSTRQDADPNNDIHVANMSLSGTGVSDAYRTAIQNSVAEGVVYVVAAGNNGRDIHGSDKLFGTSDDTVPAAYPEVATISAFADFDGKPGGLGGSTDDTFANFSNFSNSDETKNDKFLKENAAILGQDRHGLGLGIDLALPGVNIYSTYRGGGYATMSGTSMAAPHAAGLAARYIAVNGAATDANGVYEIRRALIDSGKAWRDEANGLQVKLVNGGNPDSPDAYEENLGWAGAWDAVPLTDIAITAIDVPAAVVQGESVSIGVTITNVGNQEVPGGTAVSLSKSPDGTSFPPQTIDEPLVAGASRTLQFAWETAGASLGDHVFTATATHEEDEKASNDSLAATVAVVEASTELHIDSMTPNMVVIGSFIDVTIEGSGFQSGASVTLVNGSGPQPSVTNVSVENSTTITATITANSGGPPRDRVWDVRVTNPDGASATVPGGLTVTVSSATKGGGEELARAGWQAAPDPGRAANAPQVAVAASGVLQLEASSLQTSPHEALPYWALQPAAEVPDVSPVWDSSSDVGSHFDDGEDSMGMNAGKAPEDWDAVLNDVAFLDDLVLGASV